MAATKKQNKPTAGKTAKNKISEKRTTLANTKRVAVKKQKQLMQPPQKKVGIIATFISALKARFNTQNADIQSDPKPTKSASKTTKKKLSASKPEKSKRSYITPASVIIAIGILSIVMLLIQHVHIKSSVTESPVAFTPQAATTQVATTISPTPSPTYVDDLASGNVVKASVAPSTTPLTGDVTPMAATTQVRTYTVMRGDTLWSVAQQAYGTGFRWKDIAQANKLTNATIEIGTTLTLPGDQQANTTLAKSEAKPTVENAAAQAKEAPSAAQATTGSVYIVKKGDTLWSIAEKAYGNSYEWTRIAKANNIKRPSIIHTGNTLTIPPLS